MGNSNLLQVMSEEWNKLDAAAKAPYLKETDA